MSFVLTLRHFSLSSYSNLLPKISGDVPVLVRYGSNKKLLQTAIIICRSPNRLHCNPAWIRHFLLGQVTACQSLAMHHSWLRPDLWPWTERMLLNHQEHSRWNRISRLWMPLIRMGGGLNSGRQVEPWWMLCTAHLKLRIMGSQNSAVCVSQAYSYPSGSHGMHGRNIAASAIYGLGSWNPAGNCATAQDDPVKGSVDVTVRANHAEIKAGYENELKGQESAS